MEEALLEKQAVHTSILISEKGVPLKEIARICGVSKTTMSEFARGHRQYRPDILCTLADYFDVSADYLLGRVEDNGRSPAPEIEYEITPSFFDSSNVIFPKGETKKIHKKAKRPIVLDDLSEYMKKNGIMYHAVLTWVKDGTIKKPKYHRAALLFAEASLFELSDTISFQNAVKPEEVEKYQQLLAYQFEKVMEFKRIGLYSTLDTAWVLKLWHEIKGPTDL